MGNRALVVFEEDGYTPNYGVYLHWNGGPESVFAFLEAMKARGWTRGDYVAARFAGVASEFFDADGSSDGLSLGIQAYHGKDSDPGDNGIYLVKFSQGDYVVRHRGKTFEGTWPSFDERDQKQFDGIRETLEKTRALRQRAAKEAELEELRAKQAQP